MVLDIKPISYIFLIIVLVSCKKWKYEEARIHGKVINGTLGVPMAGEKVNLDLNAGYYNVVIHFDGLPSVSSKLCIIR